MTPTQQRQLEAELAEIEAGIQVFKELAAHDPDSVVEGWVGTSKSRGTAGKPSQAKDYLTGPKQSMSPTAAIASVLS